MTESGHRWLTAAVLASAHYLAAGLGFSTLARLTGSTLWRAGAYLVSAIVFAAHIRHERTQLRSSTLTTAAHTAVAVALGAFALALAANLHAISTPTANRRLSGLKSQ